MRLTRYHKPSTCDFVMQQNILLLIFLKTTNRHYHFSYFLQPTAGSARTGRGSPVNSNDFID